MKNKNTQGAVRTSDRIWKKEIRLRINVVPFDEEEKTDESDRPRQGAVTGTGHGKVLYAKSEGEIHGSRVSARHPTA